MGKINEMKLLLNKRDLLIEKQKSDLESLKFQFNETQKVMSLENIVKNSILKINLKENLINLTLGFAIEYLIDKFPSVSIGNKLKKTANRILKSITF